VARYLALRLSHALLVVVAISLVTFLLIRLPPGDPASLVLGSHASKQAVADLDHQLGLDRPLWNQYLSWVGGVLQGDFGTSISQHISVWELIGARIATSALLIGYALVIAVAVGIPVGIAAARRRNRVVDHIVRVSATMAFAMPAFWVGLLLALLLSIKLKFFPLAGYGTGLSGHLRSLTLPAITIAVGIAPLVIRTVRASILETMSADFVESVEARGLTPRRVFYKHILRNGLIPTVTLLGVAIGSLLSGTVVVENVFAIPGLGSLLVSAVQARDFPVIEILAVLFGLIVVLVNLATDILYVAIDPRVRL
jgi:peptide/nickel transport system permease protein